ncbi:rhomboid family intramembrane serine protease GlpG [Vibrio sp. 10N.286.49.B3]|uniref:rhomboid family intramembrane serine protease GlpG n=1 Tax=Vibrio sp. 10N.286.49.B3 TaxID=1880855 RepID=UPI000C86678F|nr:rhomboid family intramembrane serine protease GlpG [Vibrio sp. 10N.286.49.B3]PMH45431.1 rhomboid family intramembrane serine protease GlpG [Vibrio sp. 10N.286.49.B3]
MIRLIALNNPRMAQAFIDYLASRKIEVKMMPEGEGQFALWLVNAEHQVEAEAELQRFLTNPQDGRYQAASWDVAETRKSQFHYDMPSMLTMIKAKAGPFTLIIMVACVVIFALQQLGFNRAIFMSLHFPAMDGQQWQVWRWISHAVLHFSLMHIAFNVLWWWQFGGDIEQKLGSKKLIQLFLVSAALSGAGQYWIEGANFGGLSGVVYALMGYGWILGERAPQKGVSVPRPIVGFMLAWLVLGFVQPFMAIANTAHLVGLLAGGGLGLFDAHRSSSNRHSTY